jgi:hypothetical protein
MKIGESTSAEDIVPSPDTQDNLIHGQFSSRERLAQQQHQVTNSSPHACGWISTSLRLPTMVTDGGEVMYLHLPEKISEYYRFNQDGAIGYSESYSSKENDHWLRQEQLDHYLASTPPLVLSKQRLLHVDLATKNNISNRRDRGECVTNTPGNDTQKSRSRFDPQMRRLNPPQHRLITSSNSGRVINVLQGEIAHCTSSQADILVSDDATTCHIVALWSRYIHTKSDGGQDSTEINVNALATLTHIDGPGYERCLREAIKEHIKYHSKQSRQIMDDDDTEDVIDTCAHQASFGKGIIDISIHIMGGFNDQGSSSIEITSSVLQAFAAVSSECPRVCMTLKTCAVASANDDGTRCPLGRGLGLEVESGSIFLAEIADDVAKDDDIHVLGATANVSVSAQGPEVTLRSMRLWASSFHLPRSERESRLVVIHRPDSEFLCINPFFFDHHPNAQRLLDCSDERLLWITSTSPDVEKPNFVAKVRESLTYMNRNKSTNVFPHGHPMTFKRVGLNGWVRITESKSSPINKI